MKRLRVSPLARSDLAEIYRYGLRQFGEAAVQRYGALVRAAFARLLEDPRLPNARQRPELSDAWSYHLRHANIDLPPDNRVARPRHLIVFDTVDPTTVHILRVLHDSMDLSGHRLREGD